MSVYLIITSNPRHIGVMVMKMMMTAMFSPRDAKMMITSNTIHHAALPLNKLPSTDLNSAGFDSTQLVLIQLNYWIATYQLRPVI